MTKWLIHQQKIKWLAECPDNGDTLSLAKRQLPKERIPLFYQSSFFQHSVDVIGRQVFNQSVFDLNILKGCQFLK